MAENKVRLTDLPNASQISDSAVMLINQGGVDYQAKMTSFLRAGNNLSEVDPAEARANLGVAGSEEIIQVQEKLEGDIAASSKSITDMIDSKIAPGIVLDHATTSWAGIKNAVDDLSTNNTDVFADLLTTKKYVTVDSNVNLTNAITLTIENQIIEGVTGFEIRPVTDNMAYAPMIKAFAKYGRFLNLRFTNPKMYKGWEKFGTGQQRQGAIDIGADYNIVERCIFLNQLNAVVANISRAAHGTKIISNYFLDCLGTGAGPDPDNPYPNSNGGEDRGDACTLWGSGSLIAYNYANCLPGQDARVAFHFESTGGGGIVNPRPFDESNNLMIGNTAYGNFRRHFVMENIKNGMCIGNTSVGGATWWCEAAIQCENVVFENTLHYDRTSDMQQGPTWEPNRGASALVNYNNAVKMRSHAIMAENSVGSGFVLQKRTDVMNFTCEMEMVNKGAQDNVAIYMVGSADYGSFNNVRAVGFARQVAFYSNPSTVSKMTFNDCYMRANGSAASAFNNTGGASTAVISLKGGEWTGNGESFLGVSNAAEVTAEGVTLDATSYAMNTFGISGQIAMKNCKTPAGKRIVIRHQGAVTGAFPSDVPWDFSGNMNIVNNFTVSQAHTKNSESKINAVGKYPGKQIIVANGTSNEVLISSGSTGTATWYNITNKTALGDITPVAPAAPTTPTT